MMDEDNVAYLITCINYSYVINTKGTIKKSKLNDFILDELGEYIINNSSSKKFESVEDVEHFWNRYDGYLVWEAYCVENASWVNIKPTNEEILNKILKMIRTNSYIDLEEINMNDFSQILHDDSESMSITSYESNFDSVYLEPNWQKIGDYEMNNSLESISN